MKILKIIPILFLTSCTNLNFDSGEFDRFLTIRELASTSISLCGTLEFESNLKIIKVSTDHQYNYSTLRVSRPQIAGATTSLKSMVDELYNRYQVTPKPSVEYCKIKTNNIVIGSNIIAVELGKL